MNLSFFSWIRWNLPGRRIISLNYNLMTFPANTERIRQSYHFSASMNNLGTNSIIKLVINAIIYFSCLGICEHANLSPSIGHRPGCQK